MSSPAITCHVNDTLDRAAGCLWDHDCGAVAIVDDDGKVTGMLTDRDICMAAYTQGRPLAEILVNVAMSSHVVSVRPDQDVLEAAAAMARAQVRRLPVLDGAGHAVGMISVNDLVLRGTKDIAATVAAIGDHRVTRRTTATIG